MSNVVMIDDGSILAGLVMIFAPAPQDRPGREPTWMEWDAMIARAPYQGSSEKSKKAWRKRDRARRFGCIDAVDRD